MKKDCELCQAPARMFCESDRACLCWDCDEKVHGANFLVARHSRILLCHSCQSPTPWKASGSKLGHTISVCETCVKRCTGSNSRINKQSHTDREDDEEEFHDADETDDDDTDETDDDDDESDDDDDEVADIQVVPWSSSTAAPPPAAPPPPPIPSCSISESSSSSSTISSRRRLASTVTLPLKRMRGEKLNHHQDDEIGCSPSPANYKEEEEVASSSSVIFSSSFRPLKDRRLAGDSTTLISSLQRFEQKIAGSSKEETEESILAICKLSKDPRAI